MNWIAALPMYNLSPALADDWRALLGHVHAELRGWLSQRGDTLTIVEPGEPLPAFWQRPDLLLSQTCGYPLVNALHERVQLVGTPVFEVDGCESGTYRSVLVTGSHTDAVSLAQCRGLRAAFNDDDSNSGMNLFRHAVAPLAHGKPFFAGVLKTHEHLASLRALVVDRTADVAAIDCVTFAFVREHLPALAAGVRVIGVTRAAPALPFIASKTLDAHALDLLTHALHETVHRDPALAARLRLKGFVSLGRTDYDVIHQIEHEARDLGYPLLA
jgi:ABC-type phosphate/phosphonate transport system substrate-binding protein